MRGDQGECKQQSGAFRQRGGGGRGTSPPRSRDRSPPRGEGGHGRSPKEERKRQKKESKGILKAEKVLSRIIPQHLTKLPLTCSMSQAAARAAEEASTAEVARAAKKAAEVAKAERAAQQKAEAQAKAEAAAAAAAAAATKTDDSAASKKKKKKTKAKKETAVVCPYDEVTILCLTQMSGASLDPISHT